ncbi:MAG: hypothetical protein M1832_003205 [Thelocarpon impressellum]|nr:MAG: hypothetical protein M1832_003205 [Thelocarpon impressellum]
MALQNYRLLNVDRLDPESSANFDVATLLPAAAAPVSAADAQTLAGQVRTLLRGGDSEGALRGALERAPYGASDDRVKELHLATVIEVLQSIKASEMSPMLGRIYASEGGTETLDVLMKYLSVSPSDPRAPHHVLTRATPWMTSRYKGMAQHSPPAPQSKGMSPQPTGGFSQIHPRSGAGAEGGGQAMSVLLSWHEKVSLLPLVAETMGYSGMGLMSAAWGQLVEVAGAGSIVRVMTDRRTV